MVGKKYGDTLIPKNTTEHNRTKSEHWYFAEWAHFSIQRAYIKRISKLDIHGQSAANQQDQNNNEKE